MALWPGCRRWGGRAMDSLLFSQGWLPNVRAHMCVCERDREGETTWLPYIHGLVFCEEIFWTNCLRVPIFPTPPMGKMLKAPLSLVWAETHSWKYYHQTREKEDGFSNLSGAGKIMEIIIIPPLLEETSLACLIVSHWAVSPVGYCREEKKLLDFNMFTF